MIHPVYKHVAFSLITLVAGALMVPSTGAAQPFYPSYDRFSSTSLNGDWKIKIFPTEQAASSGTASCLSPSFSDAGWQDIHVPGNWENQGLKPPEYGKDLSAYTGLYRKFFSYDPSWEHKHVILKMAGVSYSYELYINGQKIGEWGSAYNACSFDITNYLNKNKPNLLAVKVSTRSTDSQPKNSWQFDTNDDWSLSGISRDVTLFTIDSVYLKDIQFYSQVTKDKNALIDIAIQTGSFQPADLANYQLEATLSDPLNQHILDFKAPINKDSAQVHFKGQLTEPRCWTAETPYLYQLKVRIVKADGTVLQRSTQSVGIRSIKVEDFALKVNGTPITLHGACLSEIDPISGRARTYQEIREQLQQMKAANINFIRTAHYPFSESFFKLTDEMGFYVDAEVPFGYGDNNLSHEQYTPELLRRAEATLRDNKNHASIILWSIGNENPYTPVVEKVIEYVKNADPSRPRGLPQRGSDYLRLQGKQSPNVSVYMAHYLDVNALNKTLSTIDKPVILTEYAHSMGLAMDELEAQYANILKQPKVIGGSVWAWTDQAVLTNGRTKISGTEKQLEKGADNSLPQSSKVEQGVWLDKDHYLDNFGNNGTDGIVYATGYPQEDYYVVRKVYSPVQVLTDSLSAAAGKQSKLELLLSNRFDFKALEGYQLRWQLKGLKEQYASGNSYLHAAAKENEKLTITLNIPDKVALGELQLLVEIIDPNGLQINEKTIPIRLSSQKTDYSALLLNAPAVQDKKDQLALQLNKEGMLQLSLDGKELIHAPLMMRVGRKLTITTENQTLKEQYNWTPYLLKPGAAVLHRQKTKEGTLYTLAGDWISDSTSQNHRGLKGEVSILVRPNNTLEIHYQMMPFKEATGSLLECGLSLAFNKDFSTFRWLGAGPFSATNGKTVHNERGLWALDKADIRFDGNRGATDIAAVSNSKGQNIGLWSSSQNIGLENLNGQILISQNEIVTGYGSKFKAPRGKKPVQALGTIKGSLILYVAPTHATGSPLDAVFDFNQVVNPEQPFLKSYQW